jgi:hypothetical protein
MNPDLRARHARTIATMRRDWSPADIEDALEAHAHHVGEIQALHDAIDTATDTRALKPAAMTVRTTALASVTRRPGVECPTHGGTSWRPVEGVWACCWVEQREAEAEAWATPDDATLEAVSRG